MTLKEVEEVTGIRESHLSAVENGKIEMTQHYAEVFAAALGLHPTAFLYPRGEFKKSKELQSVERRANHRHSKIKKIWFQQTRCEKHSGNGDLWASFIFGYESHEDGSRDCCSANSNGIELTDRRSTGAPASSYPHSIHR